VLKGFQGTALLMVSARDRVRPTDPVTLEALGTLRVLDAHAGGLLARQVFFRYTMNPAASARKSCDAGKTRGFHLIPRYCSPDDKVDYVSPWAPPAPAQRNAPKEASAAAPPAASFDTVLQCARPAQALQGGGTAEDYHCIKGNAVSGSYGNYGFFQGHFESSSSLTAFINFVQIGGGGAVRVMPETGAGVVTYMGKRAPPICINAIKVCSREDLNSSKPGMTSDECFALVSENARGLPACSNLLWSSPQLNKTTNKTYTPAANLTRLKGEVAPACKVALGFPCLAVSNYTGVAPAARVWWTGVLHVSSSSYDTHVSSSSYDTHVSSSSYDTHVSSSSDGTHVSSSSYDTHVSSSYDTHVSSSSYDTHGGQAQQPP
jgi:hypothetical protein